MAAVHINKDEEMMIFARKLHNTTKSSWGYSAESYVSLQLKSTFLSHEYVLETF